MYGELKKLWHYSSKECYEEFNFDIASIGEQPISIRTAITTANYRQRHGVACPSRTLHGELYGFSVRLPREERKIKTDEG